MIALIRAVRERYHPLFYARKTSVGRFAISLVDRPAWISLNGVGFKVRGRLLTHGLAFGIAGSQERNPEALAKVCAQRLDFRSFWDVGANIGYYSWLMKTVKPAVQLLLIEPLPENAGLIRSTLDRYKFSDARLLVAGASDHSGAGTFHVDKLAGATSSLENEEQTFEERHFGVPASTLEIRLLTIDEAREVHGPADFMKIDVEGHEKSALLGAAKTICEDQPVLFIECAHQGHSCLDVLQTQGYRIVDADRLTVTCGDRSTNYFCFPKRFADAVETLLQLARTEAGI